MSKLDFKILNCCPIFASLQEQDKARIIDVCNYRELKAKELLFGQGRAADGFYLILSGVVLTYRLGLSGKEQLLHVLGEGELCGEVPVFEGSVYPANARAQGELKVLYIPAEKFLALALNHPAILLGLLAVLSKRLRKFVSLIDDLSLKEVSTRLARYLVELLEASAGDSFELTISKTQLAAQIGTIAETVSRTFARMSKQSILTIKASQITILDKERLLDIAEGEKL